MKVEEIKEAWRFVMSSNQGRMVMRDILTACGANESPFTGQSNQTMKNVGMQDAGRYIQRSMKDYAFESYLKLEKEVNEDD